MANHDPSDGRCLTCYLSNLSTCDYDTTGTPCTNCSSRNARCGDPSILRHMQAMGLAPFAPIPRPGGPYNGLNLGRSTDLQRHPGHPHRDHENPEASSYSSHTYNGLSSSRHYHHNPSSGGYVHIADEELDLPPMPASMQFELNLGDESTTTTGDDLLTNGHGPADPTLPAMPEHLLRELEMREDEIEQDLPPMPEGLIMEMETEELEQIDARLQQRLVDGHAFGADQDAYNNRRRREISDARAARRSANNCGRYQSGGGGDRGRGGRGRGNGGRGRGNGGRRGGQ